ncbi:hypothetical protein BDP27DRAFT_1322179 [Rhodocollybia butyracea]|uniref:Uncharacterized protein n=1 Tax=Rhodocollybia butyracea TaxID=206335 RepID=A0A9P5U8Y3_9AGAR|nr:hypothetical protein BDP27DRAFT_1322179 [Rhodocollybia butyracea]
MGWIRHSKPPINPPGLPAPTSFRLLSKDSCINPLANRQPSAPAHVRERYSKPRHSLQHSRIASRRHARSRQSPFMQVQGLVSQVEGTPVGAKSPLAQVQGSLKALHEVLNSVHAHLTLEGMLTLSARALTLSSKAFVTSWNAGFVFILLRRP